MRKDQTQRVLDCLLIALGVLVTPRTTVGVIW
jgi:hypothetical protein